MFRLTILACLFTASATEAVAQNTPPPKIGAASAVAIDRIDDLDSFGSSVAAVGDFDGDGVPDIAVGTPRDDDGGINRGAVWLLMLNPDVTVKSHRKISSTYGGFSGPLNDFDHFGGAVTLLGDLDGDGVPDLAVGAPRDDDGANTPNANRGAVWILFMNVDGSVKREQKISDIEGGLSAPLSDQDLFGSAVAGIGDFDGDGIPDLLVGAPGDGGALRGAVWLLLLNRDGTVKSHSKISTIEGRFTGHLNEFDNFGAAVTGLGDLDGDGILDLAVGALGDDDGATGAAYRGAVWILFMAADGSVKRHQKISSTEGGLQASLGDGGKFGASVAQFGNPDDDDVRNLAVGAPTEGGVRRGAVWLLSINTDGTVRDQRKIANLTGGFGTLSENDQFGSAVAAVGDLDSDGIPDLMVGAPNDDDGGVDRGAVWALMMEPNRIVREYRKTSNSSGGFSATLQEGDLFGSAIASLGDLDGDGIIDMAVGAPRDDDGGINRGAVWLLMLRLDGTVKTHRKISDTEGGFGRGLSDFDLFGSAVAVVGDLDGDGVAELAVGAPRDDDGAGTPNANSGAVWILFLRPDGSVKRHQKISATVGGLAGLVRAQDLFGSSLAGAGDFDGDGVADLVVGAPGDGRRGAVWLLLLDREGTIKSHRKIAQGEGGFTGVLNEFDNFGSAVTVLDDLDGDGIPELAVGAFGDDDGSGGYRGAVWILFLNADGSVKRHHKIPTPGAGAGGPASGGDHFGRALANVSDLDGDGLPELAVGAPRHADGRGALWVLFLRADGTVRDRQIIPSSGGSLDGLLDHDDRLGSAVTRIVRPGGASHIVVGAPGDDGDTAFSNRGAVWFLGDIPFPPPRVDGLNISPARPTSGADIEISSRIAAVGGISDVTLSFRRGGDAEFFSGTMRERSAENYAFTIPAFAAGPRGIEYFITASNTDGVQTREPSSGIVSIPVFVPGGLSTPLVHGTASEAYRLISVPLYLEEAGARSMLENDLGPYLRSRWRFFGQTDEPGLSELDAQDLSIEPGKAFWLMVRDEGRTLTTGPGTSVSTAVPFEIALAPGWNLIGSPYTFSIPIDQLHLRSGLPVDLRAYEGSWSNVSSTLEPLTGYAVFNSKSAQDTLAIEPWLPQASTAGRMAESFSWSIRITALRGRARDDDNRAAVADGALAARDAMDRPEPPHIGDYVSVSFPHPEWGEATSRYSTDVRPVPDRGERWLFEVATPLPERVELSFEGVEEVPARYGIWLIDEALQTRKDLRMEAHHVVMTPSRLTLAVGIDDYLTDVIGIDPELPLRNGITSSYPNPFRFAATVRYALSEAALVRLDVFDLLGQRVATLMSDHVDAGHHAAVWNGYGDSGVALASGIYVLRLSVSGSAHTHRVVLIR